MRRRPESARNAGQANGRFILAAACVTSLLYACSTWDPSRPFDRESPEVRDAVRALDAGDAQSAATTLEDYLSTGSCAEGSIGAPATILQKSNGAFDLGLSLFSVGESFGERFGDEEVDAGSPEAQQKRGAQVECALRVTRSVANDPSQSVALRARARYLEGNLLFLERSYEDAVHGYDQAIELVPGITLPPDGGDAGPLDFHDSTGRDAAWNRAIALRRIDDQKDAGNDGGDGGGDSGQSDASNNSDSGNDNKDSGGNDSGSDSGGGGNDGGSDASQPEPDGGGDSGSPPPQQPDAGSPQQEKQPPPRASQDERMLDQLENAPTMQQEEAKRQAGHRRVVRGMEDK